MATIETHCNDCIKILGKPCKEVHEWIDECAKEYPTKRFGVKHRTIRHNRTGIIEAFKKFGGSEASVAAIVHILRDKMYVCPSYTLVNKILKGGFKDIDWESL